MECPFCGSNNTDVADSRPTYSGSQVWRRRRCLSCKKIFTTYEKALINFMKIQKKSGRLERYSRAKVYTGIYGAYLRVPAKENVVDKLTDQVEANLLKIHKSVVSSLVIADIVLPLLRAADTAAFVRYLSRQRNITNEDQLLAELASFRTSRNKNGQSRG
jgi:transcriptional repressor NrdR